MTQAELLSRAKYYGWLASVANDAYRPYWSALAELAAWHAERAKS